jgi:hypothetical protein
MRHKWKNTHGLEHHHNEEKSQCENCGIIRIRGGNYEFPQVYYYPFDWGIRYKAPKCILKKRLFEYENL